MKWRTLLVALFLPCAAHALTDPLSPQFYPTGIDTNTADYAGYGSTFALTDSLYNVLQSSPISNLTSIYQANPSYGPALYAMQNEVTSFQVHVRPKVNITSLTVTLSDLVNAQTSTHISSSTTDIISYRDFYTHVATITSQGPAYMQLQGYYPDAIVPAIDPYYHQTTNAFPVAVPANTTQSAWFDIHVPTGAPSGYYLGTVTISSGSVQISSMPVVLGVWGWVMPSSASIPMAGSTFGYDTMCNVSYGGESGCGAYPGSGGGEDGANTMQWIDGTVPTSGQSLPD